MSKISVNLPEDLNKKLRAFAKKNSTSITNSCIILLQKSMESENVSLEEIRSLQKKAEELKLENEHLKEALEKEKNDRLEYQEGVIAQNLETNRKLLELMQADRFLQLQQNNKENKGFFGKIKRLFSGNKEENNN